MGGLCESSNTAKGVTRSPEKRVGDAGRVSLDDTDQTRKSICKIVDEEGKSSGTGFFMKINSVGYLITNFHVIPDNLINKIISIELHNHRKIKMELNNRDMQFFNILDITKIEVKDSDDIIKDIDFLEYDTNYTTGYKQYKNIDVFALQYPKDKIEFAAGTIMNIGDEYEYEFEHNIDTTNGSSGSPIIIPNTRKVIGIHKEGDKEEKINYGSFIGEIFKDKNKSKNKHKDNSNYIIGELYISKSDIGKKIRIINSYEESLRYELDKYDLDNRYLARIYNKGKEENKEDKNENEVKDCLIEINDIKIPFSYFHEFIKEGKFKIKYTFKDLPTNCNHIFYGCSSLTNLDLSNFDTKDVMNMSYMFYMCSNLTKVNLSNINTQKVNNMKLMFYNCSSLTNLNLSSFDTRNVKDMKMMFYNCSSLIKLNVSNFNTEKVDDMSGMFSDCFSLSQLNLNNFNTTNVKNFSCMFSDCFSLSELDLSNFNTFNSNDFRFMFYNCFSLANLNLSNFIIPNTTNINWLFYGCNLLKSAIAYDKKLLLQLNNYIKERESEGISKIEEDPKTYANILLGGEETLVPLSIINKFRKSICNISCKKREVFTTKFRDYFITGFFLKINNIKFLVTSKIEINDKINGNVTVEIFNNKKEIIKLNDRYFEYFGVYLDITIIEIKDSDKITRDIDFLEYDSDYIKGYKQYENMDIFSLFYINILKKNDILASSGKIKKLDKFRFHHNIKTFYGSSGCPIILFDSLKVVGVHMGYDTEKNLKIATFLGEILKKKYKVGSKSKVS